MRTTLTEFNENQEGRNIKQNIAIFSNINKITSKIKMSFSNIAKIRKIKQLQKTTRLLLLLNNELNTVCPLFNGRTVGQKNSTRIYFNTNYRTEMTLVPIIMDYCLL